jgi:uncharacterized membrane protein YdjX (TVP38/TMEM64 family)
VRKYLFATLLGRGPRVWFFASLGAVIPVATQVLVTYVACAIALGLAVVVWKRRTLAHRARALAPAASALTLPPS